MAGETRSGATTLKVLNLEKEGNPKRKLHYKKLELFKTVLCKKNGSPEMQKEILWEVFLQTLHISDSLGLSQRWWEI